MNRRSFLSRSAACAAFPLLSRAGLGANDGTKPPFTVGVIGHTGQGNYGHGLDTMWLGLPEQTKLVGVADADSNGLKKAAERLKLPADRTFTDYRAMLEKTRPDIVSIATRHIHEHRDMALAACAAGAKGIYMEKPFCRTPAEADQILEACAASKTRLALAHRNRYHPVLPVIKRHLEDGALGTLLEIRTRGKEDHRGGVLDLWVLGTHVLNLASYFAGSATSCAAEIYQKNKPVTKEQVTAGDEGVGPIAGDRIHARYETASGLPVFFDTIRDAGSRESGFGVQIFGTKGIIDLRIDEEPFAHLIPGHPFDPVAEARPWIPFTSAGQGAQEPEQNIKNLIAGHHAAALDLMASITENREPLCNAAEGRQTVEMICAVMESHVQGGRPVPMPSPNRENPLAAWS